MHINPAYIVQNNILRLVLLFIVLFPISRCRDLERDKFGVPITKFHINKSRNGRVLVTELDRNYFGLFTDVRTSYRQLTMKRIGALLENNWLRGKIQQPVPESTPFPCNLTAVVPLRSKEPPSTVHRLRPGDIDIVAAMGDSLTAGTGIISATIIDLINEYRSLSFANGGRGTWRNFLTLPNILRMFNPQLYGYVTQDSLTTERASVFNVAEPNAMSRDMPFQARVLIKRLQRDPRVDMQRHWKMLTIFIGNNDVCSDVCHFDKREQSLVQHERDLRLMLKELRQGVPRLFVNLIPTVNPVDSIWRIRHKPLECYLIHTVGCSCVFKAGGTPAQRADLDAFIARWRDVDRRVAESVEFRTDDFVVNFRDFVIPTRIFEAANGESDLRLLASDCFHLSQLGHATAANALWNCLLGDDCKIQWPFKKFSCPTLERPFLTTWANNNGRG